MSLFFSPGSAAFEDTAPSKVDTNTAIILALSKALESLGHSSEAIAAALAALGYSFEDATVSKSNALGYSLEGVTCAAKPTAASSSVPSEFASSSEPCNDANSSGSPESVLQHGGATLSRLELMTLKGDGWLVDAVINYVFAVLSTSYKDICFVGPALSLVLTNLQNADEKTVNAEACGLQLGLRDLVLFPVSDNTEFDKDNQGKHWSLLILQFSNDRSKCRFIHHDSLFQSNLSHASRLAGVLSHVLPEVTEFIDAESPRQRNYYDCGVFVLAMAKSIGDWWKKHGQRKDTGRFQADWIQTLKSDVTQETVTKTRRNSFKKLDAEMQYMEQCCK